MPIYEYECEGCHNVVEMWQSMSESPLAACPQCGGEVKKIISQSAFHLKGGGWYADGYSSSTAACSPTDNSDKKAAACPNAATCPCAS